MSIVTRQLNLKLKLKTKAATRHIAPELHKEYSNSSAHKTEAEHKSGDRQRLP